MSYLLSGGMLLTTLSNTCVYMLPPSCVNNYAIKLIHNGKTRARRIPGQRFVPSIRWLVKNTRFQNLFWMTS